MAIDRGDGGGTVGGIGTADADEINFTPSGDISASNVQAALAELDSEKVSVANLANTSDADKGDALVGFKQSDLTGATARTVHAKLREIVSITDFGCVGDDSTDNDSALAAAAACGADLYVPDGEFRFDTAVTFTTSVYGLGRTSVLRWTGNLASGGAVKIGHQGTGSNLRNICVRGLQIDKTSGATADKLLHIRDVQTSTFADLHLSNEQANTGATNDNILVDNAYVNTFMNITSRRAGRYALHFDCKTAFNVDAANQNLVLGGAYEDSVSAGIYISNAEHNVLHGVTFEDFAGLGQHGVHLDGRATGTVIRDCYFEEQATASNDIRVTGSNGNTGIVIEGCIHRGGPTTELHLDYASNARVMCNFSVTTGTYANVTANTDRAWFFANVAGAATTYVNDSGTNTIIWGDKAGGPVLNRAIMANNSALQAYDASSNLRTLVILQASGALNVGDSNQPLFLDGASINFNAGLRSSFLLATPTGAAQTKSLYAGTGAPNNANGADGDFYFRTDGTVAGNTVMYHKEGGSWVAFTTT